MDLALPRPIKFTEVEALPGAEDEAAVFNDQRLAGSEQAAFDMGRAVPFEVAVSVLHGHQLVDCHDHVSTHIRVGIFIDRNRCRSVRGINDRHTISDAAIPNCLTGGSGYVDHFHLVMALNGEGQHLLISSTASTTACNALG